MKKLLKLAVFLIIALVGAAIIVPFLIPMETYKKEAIARLSEMTGRSIAIDGDISFRIVPDVAVVLNDVTVGNPEGFQSPYLAKVKSLNVGVALNPLFNKELVIQKFELEKPDINLEELASGKQNWNIEFKRPELPKAELISSAHAASDDTKSFELKKVELSKLAISGGRLSYLAKGITQQLSNISLTSDEVKMNAPTAIKSAFDWNGKNFAVYLNVDSLEQLMNKKTTDGKVTVESEPFKVNFQGKLSASSMRGSIDAGSSSLVKAMEWLGKPIDWKKTPLLLAVKGQANCNMSACELSGSNIAVDALRLNGDVRFNYAEKLSITGDLTTDTLDLTPYMMEQQAALAPNFFISNAYAKPVWSNDTIDLSGLRDFDLDIILSAKRLVTPEFKASDIKMQPQIRGGSASINIIQSKVFDGSLSGVLTALPRDNYINFGANVKLAGVELESFLKSFDVNDSMSGKTNLNANLNARANSVAGIIQSLSGKADLAIQDGVIHGVNLGEIARNFKSLLNRDSVGGGKTDFTELTATFNIVNGVISNNDLYMKAPFLRVRGEGNISLPAYSINYRLNPELVETSKGQGGKDKTGIKVPIMVTGSLEDPKFTPDVQAILENKDAIKENIRAIKDQIKEGKQDFKDIKNQFKDIKKNPEQLLKNPDSIEGLLQGFGKKPAPTPEPAPQPVAAPEPVVEAPQTAPAESAAPAPVEAAPTEQQAPANEEEAVKQLFESIIQEGQ